jgi:Ca-activated chloride channel family protein
MAFVALNTALDPQSLPRAPRHLILVIEDTQRTRPTISSLSTITDALEPALRADDRVSVIVAGEQASLLADSVPRAELGALAFSVAPGLKVDLYYALSTARELALATDDALVDRIVLFTSGVTDTGIHQPQPFVDLAQSLAESGVAISTIGMGADYRGEIPTLLADIGSGNYYFVQNTVDLGNAVVVETETAFVPLARNLELTVEAQAGYRIGRIHGARRAVVSETTAVLSTPTLYLGAREGASDLSSGRRGGGGGWFVELRADVLPGEGPAEPADAFVLRANYDDAQAGGPIARSSKLVTPLGVGQNPDPTAPFFSDADRAKAFMMLNMYLALKAAVSLYEAGECSRALGVEQMMTQSYEYWAAVYADADIDADWLLLRRLTHVIDMNCDLEPVKPVEIDAGCFMF